MKNEGMSSATFTKALFDKKQPFHNLANAALYT